MSSFISEIQQLLLFLFKFSSLLSFNFKFPSSICAQQVKEIRDVFFESFIKDNGVDKSDALDQSSNISRQIWQDDACWVSKSPVMLARCLCQYDADDVWWGLRGSQAWKGLETDCTKGMEKEEAAIAGVVV